jgi:hypothetical protein
MWPAIIGGAIAGYGAYRANKETASSTAKQMAFQERMSNTAHQRQMADLKMAGINPMLSAKLGGASSPAGASYQASNIGSAAVEGYGKVSSAKQAQAQTTQIKAQTALTQEQTKRAVEDLKQIKVNFAERWYMKFAGMSSENIVASVQAVLKGVDVHKVLTQTGIMPKEYHKLENFLEAVRAQASTIRREADGIQNTVKDWIGLPTLDDKYSHGAKIGLHKHNRW